MGSKGRAAVGLTIWAALLLSVLQIGQASALDSHGHGGLSICGPWGCGPPVRALIGWHGFWLVFLTLPGVLLVRSSSATRLWWLGLILSIAGVLSLVAICVYEAVNWLPRVPDGAPTYFTQRCLFRIATWTDPPLAALTVLGLAMFFAALVKEKHRHRAGMNAESGP